MTNDTNTIMRRHLRFVRYLPVRCTPLEAERSQSQPLDGRTRVVNAGGLEILLPEMLPVETPVLVQVSDGDPVRARIVSVREGTPTLLGPRFPHGVAFKQPVDPALVRQWVSHPKQRVHPRASVELEIEFTTTEGIQKGTCLNLSQRGMFIATEHPPPPGTEVMLHFSLPGLSYPLSDLAQVMWICAEETPQSPITGMGVRFLETEPSEAAMIGTVVECLREEQSPAPDSSRSAPPSG